MQGVVYTLRHYAHWLIHDGADCAETARKKDASSTSQESTVLKCLLTSVRRGFFRETGAQDRGPWAATFAAQTSSHDALLLNHPFSSVNGIFQSRIEESFDVVPDSELVTLSEKKFSRSSSYA